MHVSISPLGAGLLASDDGLAHGLSWRGKSGRQILLKCATAINLASTWQLERTWQLLVANPENMAHQGAALSYNSRWSAYMREMVHSERSAALRFADVPPRRPRFGFGHAVPVLAPLPVAAVAPAVPSPRRRRAPRPGSSQREASLTLPPIQTVETTTARDFSPPIRGMACFMSGRRHGRRVCDEFRNGQINALRFSPRGVRGLAPPQPSSLPPLAPPEAGLLDDDGVAWPENPLRPNQKSGGDEAVMTREQLKKRSAAAGRGGMGVKN